MAEEDRLVYFNIRARAEAIRMLYAVAGKPLKEERIDWSNPLKKAQPLGQLPVYTSEQGEMVMSNSIARHVARKFGMMGDTEWEATMNDMIQEISLEIFNDVRQRWYHWKIHQWRPAPDNPEELLSDIRDKMLKRLNYIQAVSERAAKRFILCDQICLADVWLYATLEFCKLAIPDVMEITPWVKDFVAMIESEEKMKEYLANRPDSLITLDSGVQLTF